MHAAILSIGDELTLGQNLDTNARWLSARLAEVAVEAIEHRTVGDDRPAIAAALRDLCARAEVVIVTGGLGPTEDDLTREALYDSNFDRATITELDGMWRAASDDHFGFSVQPGLVGVRPPRGHGIATHRYVDAVACACGWRGWNHWRALEDSPRSERFSFVQPIPRHGPPQSFSRGLFGHVRQGGVAGHRVIQV